VPAVKPAAFLRNLRREALAIHVRDLLIVISR